MTYEEAIERLRNRYFTVSMCIDANDAIKENMAIDIAIEAIEKRTPIKPISKYGRSQNVCPNCETDSSCRIVLFWENYCPECGQRIDWSET